MWKKFKNRLLYPCLVSFIFMVVWLLICDLLKVKNDFMMGWFSCLVFVITQDVLKPKDE